MDKEKFRYLGFECLLLLVLSAAAGTAYAVQFQGRSMLGSDDSFMFVSTAYEYNYLAYIGGIVIFFAALAEAFKIFNKKVSRPRYPKAGFKVVATVIAAAFALLMFGGLLLETFAFLGLGGSMRPEILMNVMVFGMPVITAGCMVYNIFHEKL
jgi:hypothetical protein